MKNPLCNLLQGVLARFFVLPNPVLAIENRVQDAGPHVPVRMTTGGGPML